MRQEPRQTDRKERARDTEPQARPGQRCCQAPLSHAPPPSSHYCAVGLLRAGRGFALRSPGACTAGRCRNNPLCPRGCLRQGLGDRPPQPSRTPHAHSNCDPGMLNPPVPGGEAAWASGALRMRRPGRKARFGFTASFLSLGSWLPFTRWSVPRSSPCPIAWGSVQKGWPGPHLGKDGVGPLPQPRGWNMAWLCPTGGEDLSHRTILAPIHVPLD